MNSTPIALYGRSSFVSKIDVSGTTYDVLNMFAPGEITYAVEVPPRASLSFGFHLIPHLRPPSVANINFQIDARPLDAGHDSPPQIIFQEQAKLGNYPPAAGPNHRRADLGALRLGQTSALARRHALGTSVTGRVARRCGVLRATGVRRWAAAVALRLAGPGVAERIGEVGARGCGLLGRHIRFR